MYLSIPKWIYKGILAMMIGEEKVWVYLDSVKWAYNQVLMGLIIILLTNYQDNNVIGWVGLWEGACE